MCRGECKLRLERSEKGDAGLGLRLKLRAHGHLRHGKVTSPLWCCGGEVLLAGVWSEGEILGLHSEMEAHCSCEKCLSEGRYAFWKEVHCRREV